MTQDPTDSGKPDPVLDRKAQREARLAEALRANLKRRKAQARARKDGAPSETDNSAASVDGRGTMQDQDKEPS